MTSSIHIALASDDNYFEGLLVTAYTIARNCSRADALTIHVLDGGVTKEHWSFLEKKDYPVRRKTQPARHRRGEDIRESPHLSRRVAHNLCAATSAGPIARCRTNHLQRRRHALARRHRRALGFARFKCHHPLHPFHALAASRYRLVPKIRLRFEHGKRFCAGLIVFNLAKFRSEDLHRQMLAALERCGGKAPCNDETVLNALTFGRPDRGFLPSRWQHYSAGQEKPFESNGLVLHFLVDTPWQSLHKYNHLLTNQRILWHRFHAEARQITPWRSMRMANGVLDIILCRSLFLLASSGKPGQWAMKCLLSLRGKADSWPVIEAYTRPFVLPTDFNRALLPRS